MILATDGDLNVGLTSESELEELITEKKESGVFLSVLGFGRGILRIIRWKRWRIKETEIMPILIPCGRQIKYW